MNRATRRSVGREVSRRAKVAGDVIRLVGGPMDGWLVTPTAPALKPGWPPPHDDYGPWGHYGEVVTQGGERTAQWVPDP